MSQYNYTIEYVPGKKMGHADALSRRSYSQQLPEAQLHPIVSPFYDMDEESRAKVDCFPALSVGTQIEKVCMRNQATQNQGEVIPRSGLALPISQLDHKKEDRVERQVDLDYPSGDRVNKDPVGRNSRTTSGGGGGDVNIYSAQATLSGTARKWEDAATGLLPD